MKNSAEIESVNWQIRKKMDERRELKQLLDKNKHEINVLENYKALQLEVDKKTFSVFRSIPDHLENILKERKEPMHLYELVSALNEQGISASEQTVSTGLLRYANKNRRFIRVSPNTYDLLNKKEQNSKNG